MKPYRSAAFALALISSIGFLSGCGSSSSSSSSSPTDSDVAISGSSFASYVDGADVTVTDIAGNVLAGPVSSNSDGGFTVRIDSAHLASQLIFKSTGGTFRDESTGLTTTGGELSAFLDASALDSNGSITVSLTPGTTLIQKMISDHGVSLSDAQARFENHFGYLPDTAILPTDATSPAADADDARKLAGLRAAAFSQLTSDLGLDRDKQFELLARLAEDLADGDLDGMANGLTALDVDGTAMGSNIQDKFAQSLIGFKNGAKNNTGLANDKIGILPFAKVAMSDSYKVTYIPGMMGATVGKSSFKLSITDLDGTPQTGLNPMLMPMMYMATHQHTTPVQGIVEDNEQAGGYNATLYYLMASKMMVAGEAVSMGYWDLKITLPGDEEVHFYPAVTMAMGDTAAITLKGGATDMVPGMMGAEATNRSYRVFNNGLSADAGNHGFSVFISAKESMMSFPALDLMTLNAGAGDNELTITDIAVEMSTDQNNWTTATNTGTGIWTASGLTGLSMDVEADIYVRLTVNGEQKTGDGYFTVTPAN